ncbi:MAG TPA: hypothetical protein PKM88_07530 [bacterium]|nr:hypothetical protein [bacterium]
MNFRPFSELSKDERRELSTAIVSQIQASQEAANAPEVQYQNKIKIGALYGSNRQPVDRFAYSAYRDKSVWRTIQTNKALLTSNDPKPSFQPDGPFDVPLAEVMQHVLVDILDDIEFTDRYMMVVDDELTYSTGFFEFILDEKKRYGCDIEVVPLASIGVGDWHQTDMSRQPFWYRAGLMKIEKANGISEDGDVVPNSDTSLMTGLKLMFSDWWKSSGSDAVKNPLVSKDDAEREYLSGNVFFHKYQVKDDDDTVWEAYLVNGKLISFKQTTFEDYTLCPYRNKKRNMSFLGTSEAELSKDVSDARSEALQMLMAQTSAFGKKLVEINENAGISKAEGEEWLQKPMTVVVTNADTFANNASFRIHEFNHGLDASQLQMFQLMGDILETDTNNTKWVSGSAPSGPDPAAKVTALMKAGMAQIQAQATVNDHDGTARLTAHILWHIQTNLKREFVVSVVGKYLPDGSPRFVDVNMAINKDEMNLLLDAADHAEQTGFTGKLKFNNTLLTPENIRTQIEAIHERIDKSGMLEYNLLNNLAMARVKIKICDSQELPYSEAERKAVAAQLLPSGVILPEEVREIYRFRTDPATMAKLPITQQAEAQRRQQELMAQQGGQ